MKLRRQDLYVVVHDGRVHKIQPTDLGPLKPGFSQFLILEPNGEAVRSRSFLANDLKEASDRVGAGGVVGYPVGSTSRGVVFRVARVTD